MKIIDNLTEKQFNDFLKKSKYNHFLQTYEWGQACKVRHQIPVYLGLVDEKNNIKAVCLALRRNTPLNMCYFYAPRGPVIDYNNKELLKEFTIELKKYLKQVNGISFVIDPGIMYQEIDENANPIENGKNNYELFNYFKELGYIHKGFSKYFENNQPRYTFRINTKSLDDVTNNMNKTYLKTIKRSYNYFLEVSDEYDNETFYSLMKDIANRNNFNGNPKKFYEEFYNNYNKNGKVRYITIKIYPDKILEYAKNELENIKKQPVTNKHKADTDNLIKRYEKDIETFKEYENKYPDGLVSLILICPIIDNKMWTLYIGNNSLASYTFAVNRAYYEAIKYACENNMEFLDLFGTTGNPKTTLKNYAGIHEYKRKMGGTYTEFIGQFDLVNKKFWYKVLPTLLKIYRKFRH